MTKTEQIIKLHKKGHTVNQISDLLCIKANMVRTIINRKGFKVNRYKKVNVDNKLKQFIYGTVLGDGHLTKVAGAVKNSRLTLIHGMKQCKYVEYKSSILSNYDITNTVKAVSWTDRRFPNKKQTGMSLRSKCHPLFTKYRKLFYLNGSKIIPDIVLNELDAFGISFLFMDDGYITTSSIILSLCGFELEYINRFKKMFYDRYNLEFNITKDKRVKGNKGYRLYLKTKCFDEFKKLVSPYILKEFNYKLVPYTRRVL